MESAEKPNSPTKFTKLPTQSTVVGPQADFKLGGGTLVLELKGRFDEHYELQKESIGSGAFGEVKKGVHKLTKMTRAVKIIHKSSASKEEQERLVNEVNVLRKLDHPNIIKIYDFMQDDQNFYIASELCTGGELFDKIIKLKSFSEKMAADILRQILSAVAYCHSHNIVHRDLKPENVLYENPKDNAPIKVIDFGTSKTFDPNEKMTQKFGTPYYIAPEVLRRRYDLKCDIWSIGVMAYVLLCGYPPFNASSDKLIMEKVAKGFYSFDGVEWKAVSTEAKDFIRKMLEFDTVKRYSATEALNDPWLVKTATSSDIDKPLMINTFNNLKSFRADSKLAQASWGFLVSFMATKEEKAELLKLFKALDMNSDGLLSREELLTGYKTHFKSTNPEEEVDQFMKSADSNGNGFIDYSEFVMATINRKSLLSKQRLEAAFRMFDKDGNGSISKDELKEFFSGGGETIEDEQFKQLIKEVDQNGDGEISFDEFKEMMMKIVES